MRRQRYGRGKAARRSERQPKSQVRLGQYVKNGKRTLIRRGLWKGLFFR
jgi:hypothetical protein